MKTSLMNELKSERERQNEKWGEPNHHAYKWLAILGEEYGEACKDILDVNPLNYRNELLQVAAVAIAAIESFDRHGLKGE